ncbi:hypothetical protein ACIBG7_07610 [Nonomuraea sp. NPDC050328]|uniref:hypothetical protein n=1 Tax=Nonomuraea sp. NPDC050328 TaxID=3364361 RepID=UPI003799DA62
MIMPSTPIRQTTRTQAARAALARAVRSGTPEDIAEARRYYTASHIADVIMTHAEKEGSVTIPQVRMILEDTRALLEEASEDSA